MELTIDEIQSIVVAVMAVWEAIRALLELLSKLAGT